MGHDVDEDGPPWVVFPAASATPCYLQPTYRFGRNAGLGGRPFESEHVVFERTALADGCALFLEENGDPDHIRRIELPECRSVPRDEVLAATGPGDEV